MDSRLKEHFQQARGSGLVVDAPRWLFLFALVAAPWAYGSTRDWTAVAIGWLLIGIAVLWVATLAVRRRRPEVNPILLGCVVYLLLHGWFVIWNAQYFYDRTTFEFVPIASAWKEGPGALDRVDAVPMMIRMTGLLLMMCFACDLAMRPVWRLRLWWTVSATAGSLMLFGLIREVMGLKLIGTAGLPGPTSFATYFYHANAAAYINLALPLVAGLCIVSFERERSGLGRALWPAVLLLCIAGAATAASKAGMVITVAIVLSLAFWQIVSRYRRGVFSVGQVVIAAACGVVLMAAAATAGWHRAERELSLFPELLGHATAQSRLLVAQTCLRMLPDAGLWGMGPGNFAIAFPHYTNHLGDTLTGLWELAHQDYLQTAIEWGWIGAAVWSLILFGGIVAGVRNYLTFPAGSSRGDRILVVVTIAGVVGVALHAAVDFPLQIASIQLYTATYLGLLWGAGRWPQPRRVSSEDSAASDARANILSPQ